MLDELEEEALQVQHSHIKLQGTVETHRSCRASSFCSEIERFINQDQTAAAKKIVRLDLEIVKDWSLVINDRTNFLVFVFCLCSLFFHFKKCDKM